MGSDTTGTDFRIWGADNAVYGPVELPILVNWVKEGRVTPSTWVFSERDASWQRAQDLPELRIVIRPKKPETGPAAEASPVGLAGIKPDSLRRVRIFAEMTDEQLERFVQFMEVQSVRQWTEIVKQGDPGDAMYLVLEGELRVRMMISGKETILVTLTAGEFFGEISLFDHGPRSADVVANQDSVLIRISAETFQRMLVQAPELAAPFVYAVGKTLTARIRADNKRYRDSVAFARAAGSES